MRNFIWTLLILLLFDCQNISKTEQIYDDYLQMNSDYWSRVNNLEFYSLFNYHEGDTLMLNPEFSFLMIPHDTVVELAIEPENFFEILEQTQITITKSFEYNNYSKGYEFKTLNLDSNLLGHINSDDLIKNIEGIDAVLRNKDYLLNRVGRLDKEYKERIARIAASHQITIDSLYRLLAKEHFKATGDPIFSY